MAEAAAERAEGMSGGGSPRPATAGDLDRAAERVERAVCQLLGALQSFGYEIARVEGTELQGCRHPAASRISQSEGAFLVEYCGLCHEEVKA